MLRVLPSHASAILRRLTVVGFALALVACGDCDSPCKEGITFHVGDVAGALSAGGQEPVTICFDGDCKETTITRDDSGGSIFLPFKGVGNDDDHALTVTGTGALKGEYDGKIFAYFQDPGGDCKTCALATVKFGADGTLTPAILAPENTTSTAATAATTTAPSG